MENHPAHLDTTNAEFDEGAKHLATSDFIGSATDGALDEQAVVVGLTKNETENKSKLTGRTVI